MKSLIIGANGGVGQHLVRKLKARDVDFTAGVRKEEQVEALKADGIDATYIDVAKQSIDELIELFKSYDQILFSVGSGGSTGDDQTIIVDLDGAVKAIKAKLNRSIINTLLWYQRTTHAEKRLMRQAT